MRIPFAAALAAAALSFGLAAGTASAAQAADAVTTPAPTASKFSVETTLVGDMLANDGAKAVVLKYLPTLMDSPYLEQVKQMTLRALSAYPQANLDDEKLKAMQAELDAVK